MAGISGKLSVYNLAPGSVGIANSRHLLVPIRYGRQGSLKVHD